MCLIKTKTGNCFDDSTIQSSNDSLSAAVRASWLSAVVLLSIDGNCFFPCNFSVRESNADPLMSRYRWAHKRTILSLSLPYPVSKPINTTVSKVPTVYGNKHLLHYCGSDTQSQKQTAKGYVCFMAKKLGEWGKLQAMHTVELLVFVQLHTRMQWRVVPVTFFPSLISLLSTDGIVSSTQQASVPSHLMVTPGSEHGCGVIYRSKAKIYQGLHLREMAPHPHQRLTVTRLLGRGGASWALPPLVENC